MNKDNSQEKNSFAKQKRFASHGFKRILKRMIESMVVYNIDYRKNELKAHEMRDLAKYFAVKIDTSNSKSRESTGVVAVLEKIDSLNTKATKKSK
jgi:hypothetical protein